MGQGACGGACGGPGGGVAEDLSAELQAKMRRVHWVPLESNPDVLNAFATRAGLPSDWEFVDVFGVDPELIAMVPPTCVAVTLLFQCSPALARFSEAQRLRIERKGQVVRPGLVYLKQYIGNACGTIACIHSLANNAKALGLPEQSPLGRYLAGILGKSPEVAGEMLADAADLHEASQASAAGGQTAAPEATASVDHHFVAFVEHGGDVYELDGCKAFPINHGPSGGRLLDAVAKVVKASFMEQDADNIHFNMMALVRAT